MMVLRRIGALWAFLGEAAQAALRIHALRGEAANLEGRRFEDVIIIGAYGGDHVGDTAILGGVLLHLHRTYGTRRAHVMSHRADRTRRLVAGLETPVAVEVHDYRPRSVDSLFETAQALVLAGGPLMDLPRVLAKHLAAIGTARAQGRPFLIERVGIGPFRRRISRWAARRIARAASRISVRTGAAAADPVLAGLEVEVGRDPAFDYLATRSTLGRLTPGEAESVSALLAGTQGRLLVGINIRPIPHFWGRHGASRSRAAEQRFYDRISEGLRTFARDAQVPVTYIGFPMNPIEFGGSDLAAAHRLRHMIGGAVDFRIWEADPDVDGVLHLLRRLDMAIAMRFHACIFALSQGLPVLGIDYFAGRHGKTKELFDDLDRCADLCRFDALEADWLAARLRALATEKNCPRGTGTPQADDGTRESAISVIIPMYNARHHLPLVLKPLLAMLKRGELAEVLVVDDASSDDSAAVARDLGATVLTAPRNGGPGAARNIGAAQAKGEILWFVDSDVIVHEDGARQIKEAFKDPGTVAVFGSYDDMPPARNFMSQYKNLVHHYYHQRGREAASTFWAGCGAIRKRAFDEIEGYDVQRYSKPSIEDIELGYRLRARGGRIRLLHDLRCTHLKMWTLKGTIETDIFMRAIPWSRLMIGQGALTDDLNVSTTERWRAILAGLLALSSFAAVLWPDLAWFPIAMLAAVFLANRQFFAFLCRRRGLVFAILGTLFHQVYYLYSSAAFAWCWLEARLGLAKKAAATE